MFFEYEYLLSKISKILIGHNININKIRKISYNCLIQNDNKMDRKSINIHKNQLAGQEKIQISIDVNPAFSK
jgi:hypothetical protein